MFMFQWKILLKYIRVLTPLILWFSNTVSGKTWV